MRKYLFVLSLILFISCKKEQNSKMEIHFFNVDNLNTIVPLSCENMDELNYLTKIYIEDKKLYESILKDLDTSKIEDSVEEKIIDVRYKIIVDTNVMCVDNFGNFCLNKKHYGKIGKMEEIKTYIASNKEKYIKITEGLPPLENLE